MQELNSATLHHAILHSLVERCYAPDLASLARQFEVDTEVAADALRELESLHGVVLHPHRPEVWIAHPFSTAPTPFAVKHASRVWWGNCAWCSLGVAALVGGHDVTIHTTLGAEGEPVTVHIENGRVREDLWVHFPIPMAKAWDNVVYTCSTMLVFASESEIDEWCTRHALPRGDAQPIQLAYEFAAVWYGQHLNLDWRKWTLEEARLLFARFGFKGTIWALSESEQRF
jgi:hypothetical protein